MKKKSLIVAVLLMLMSILLIIACNPEEQPVIEKISISVLPHKDKYFAGDEIDLNGGEIMLHYSDGGYIAKPMDDKMSIEYDFSKEGRAEVTISYMGHSAYFDVTVAPLKTASVKIKTNPSVIDCTDGQLNLDYSSGIVVITLNNESSFEKRMDDGAISTTLSDYTWDYLTSEIKVTLKAKYMDTEDSCIITMNDARADYLNITSLPDCNIFFMDESISFIDGSVTIGTSLGFSTDLLLTNENVEIEYDFTAPGEAPVTVRIGQLTDIFWITVLPEFDWDYFGGLIELAKTEIDAVFLGEYVFDSDFLAYYYMLSDQVDAIFGGDNFKRRSEYILNYSNDYAAICDFYNKYFENAFSIFEVNNNFYDFIRFYCKVYYWYYLEGYSTEEDFTDDVQKLMDMFFALDEEGLKAFFLIVRDSGDSFYYISEEYYSYDMTQTELYAYYYLYFGEFYYTLYLYNNEIEMLGKAMNYIMESNYFYDGISDKTLFNSYFGEMYSKYHDIYKAYEASKSANYDWDKLDSIISYFYAVYQNNDYVLLIYYYNLLLDEQAFFESIKTSNSDLFHYYIIMMNEYVIDCIELFDEVLKTPAFELFEGAGLEFISYFSEAAYLYVSDQAGNNLLSMVEEIDRLRADMTTLQKTLLQYYLSGYWYYFIEMHWDAYYPDLLSEDETNVYAYLLSADAYYCEWLADVRGEAYREYALFKFINTMEMTNWFYSRLSTQSMQNFNQYFGELYQYWKNIFYNLEI